MRGDDNHQEGMFSYVSPEKRVPADHPSHRRVQERAKPFMSDEHLTVDGTLIEAWASQKSQSA
jgi:hypothetical protein